MEMFWNSNFHFKPFLGQTRKERERERARARGRRRSLDHAFDIANEPRAPIQWPHAPDCTGFVDHSTTPITPRVSISPLDLASARSRLWPRAFNPPISLCDFDFCCCCGGVVVVFWWLWLLIAGVCCRGLNWSFGYVWCGDLAMILKFFVIKFVWMLRK